MVHFENDYKFGIENQINILPILKSYFNSDIIPHLGSKWAKYDYSDKDTVYELKTRKVRKKTYPTTLLTCNKVVESIGKKIVFLFHFKDELSYIEYDKELFSTFEKRPYSRIGEVYDEKDYYFIPIEHLKTINI